MATADERAADGFSEFKFDDGALIQVSAYGGQVCVLQQQGSTQGRGAAFLSVDDAEALASAVSDAAAVAKKQRDEQPAAAPTQAPAPVSPGAAAGLSAADIAAIVNAALDARGVPATKAST